ncbi:putative 4-coumarate--CoA ligase 1 [Haemaphysalis longicornis]
MKPRIEDRVVYSPYPDIEIPLCSFYTLIEEQLQKNPNSMALVDDVVSLTRGEVLAQFKRYAVGFRSHGVMPGDRICVHFNNSVENIAAMYGCVLAGATVVMMKTSLTEQEILYQAQDCDSTQILTEVEFTEKILSATAVLNMKGLFSMGPAAGFVSAADFATLDEREFQDCPVTDPKNTIMAVYYTSGSTGLPKGVEISHYNFVACFYTCRQHLPWRTTEISLGANPITHISGLIFQIMPVLNGAVGAVVSSMSTPIEIIDAIDKYKATVMLTFPALLHAVIREMQCTGRRLPTMRHIVTGGAVVTEWLSNTAHSTFGGLQRLQNIYGTTEGCLLISSQPEDLDIRDRGSDVGCPAVNVRVKVIGIISGEKLGPNQMGEICFKNASMVKGYYKRPKESADLFEKHGWMKSGDAGYYDEDGRLYFFERLKQMIKCMDNQVVPAELEELLLFKHGDEVAEVSVVGLPHAEYGEAPAAAVVLTEKGKQQERALLAAKMKATVADHLSVHKHLHGGVFFLECFPKTETSKVNRLALARSLIII